MTTPKAAVVYVSVHHGNTRKIATVIADELSADLIDILNPTEREAADFSQYHLIGFASGIFYNNFHKNMKDFLETLSLSERQRVFLAATCGITYKDYTKKIKQLFAQKNIKCLGSFQCRGFNTFGPFGKIGGIAKGHPNQKDLENARQFAHQMLLLSLEK